MVVAGLVGQEDKMHERIGMDDDEDEPAAVPIVVGVPVAVTETVIVVESISSLSPNCRQSSTKR